MQIDDEMKQWIREKLVYNEENGALVWRDCEGDAVVVRRKRFKVRYLNGMDAAWLDAASVCWFLWKDEWPEWGVVIVSKEYSRKYILSSWNLKKRSRADYMKHEVILVSRELLEIAMACVLERYGDVCKQEPNDDEVDEMLFNVNDVMLELDFLLNGRRL